jgi:Peptidase family S49/Peptidase family S49 N-terminal
LSAFFFPSTKKILSLFKGKEFKSNISCTVDTLGYANEEQIYSTSDGLNEIITHLQTFQSPYKDLRTVVRSVEQQLLNEYSVDLTGHQDIDIDTQLEENILITQTEQRLNDLLLDGDHTDSARAINRQPIYICTASNLSDFLETFRIIIRSIEVGIPVVVLSEQTNRSQHYFRYIQLLQHLLNEKDASIIESGMITYVSAPINEIHSLSGKCRSKSDTIHATFPGTISIFQQSNNIRAQKSTTTYPSLLRECSTAITAGGAANDIITAASSSPTTDQLWIIFWQSVIQNSVPAFFVISVIAFGAYQFRPKQNKRSKSMNEWWHGSKKGSVFDFDRNNDSSPIALLYDDLYGNQDQDPLNRTRDQNPFSAFTSQQSKKRSLLKNIGVPKQQFIKVTYINEKYDSFKYSINAATTSKANAALQYRQSSLVRALQKVIGSTSDNDVDVSTWSQMQKLEEIYLSEVSKLYNQLYVYQNQFTLLSIQDELTTNAGMDEKDVVKLFTEVDPKVPITANIIKSTGNTMDVDASPSDTATISLATTSDTSTKSTEVIADTADTATTPSLTATDLRIATTGSSSRSDVMSSIQRIQKDINELDMEFVKRIIRIAGPDKAAGINAALLGTPGAAGLLSSTTVNGQRPLARIFGSNNEQDQNQKKNVYVMNFPGDVTASQVSDLRQVVTSIILAQKQKQQSASGNNVQDEAVVVLQSGGGTVTGYGLAAAQLLRLKVEGQLKLTICVEQVAASGGYMMACCADTIIASPFAVLGSIGVITDIPNVYDRLKHEGIEFQTITAGK